MHSSTNDAKNRVAGANLKPALFEISHGNCALPRKDSSTSGIASERKIMTNGNLDALIDRIKIMANDHHQTPEVRYLFETRFTPARARCWTIHQASFVRNRRDCWALAMGQAP